MDRAAETQAGTGDAYLIEELSTYLDILSHGARLKILRLLEKTPMDATAISREIETSYENTKKHLDRLLSIGVIRKEAGLGRETSKGVHPVWMYSLVPGSLEAIIRTLGAFSNVQVTGLDRGLDDRLAKVRGEVAGELLGGRPRVVIVGGPDDGKAFPVADGETRIGRREPGEPGGTGGQGHPSRTGEGQGGPGGQGGTQEIVLDEGYRSITRIARPHGKFLLGKVLTYEDCRSTAGSSLNGTKVRPGEPVPLRDGDFLDIGSGITGVRLILAIPPSLNPPAGSPGQ